MRPHRRQPTRLLCPWDSPGKNTGVGCHFLLQCMKVKRESEVAQSCPTPSNPMDCSLPGSSVHGIFQATVLEWGAITKIIACGPITSWQIDGETIETVTDFIFSLSCIGEGNGSPLQCSCLENPRGGGAWWAAIYGVAWSWTRLKRLSSSSNGQLATTAHYCSYHGYSCFSNQLYLYYWWKSTSL